ncbi:glycosyltransferase, partial [Seonamhaeicola sp.]|uniref:glycosyltransferase n=1 Tax=Seonamhaeicola sp. TaxID=1912245 RepID=UPI0035669D86
GHQYCIEVIYSLLRQGVKAKLTIIGEGEEKDHLESIINSYKLNKSIILLGSKNSGEVREALWKHDIYLLLAVPVENDRRETQGLATLEAQACGLPAIVFNSGGVKYTVKDNVSGYVCEEYDVEAVAEKVKYLFENREKLTYMGENAVKFVNNMYSQKKIDEKWKHLYNYILKREG